MPGVRLRSLGSRLIWLAALAAAAWVGASAASAQPYPNRVIRIIHGFAPGGAADTLSRIIAEGLSKQLGQNVIVEAKPGAGGNIGSEAVAKAEDSFQMISTIVYYALVVAVRSDFSAKTLGELIAIAKANPGTLSFGSVGFGSTHHLAGELLKKSAGIDMVHVPYRGDSQAIGALLSGDVPVIVGTTVLLAPQIESGTVRGLAVTSPTRSALLPNVPTAAEAGLKDFDVRTWAGLLAPKGTPPEIVAQLNKAVQASLADPAITSKLEAAVGGEARGSTPAEMHDLVASEIVKWRALIEAAKIPKI
jgi:tripartite-type tricarboxylate transporter receptor subunit TctC